MDKEPTENTTSDGILQVADTPQELSEKSDHALGNLETLSTEPAEATELVESAESIEPINLAIATATDASSTEGSAEDESNESTQTVESAENDSSEAEVIAEPFVTDPLAQMEREAEIAESDAKDIVRLQKIAENGHPITTPTEETQPVQPVDVRQDFIDQMHAPKPQPKGNTGKKIAITALVVLAVGLAGFFVWWFAYYSQPKKVLADALGNLVSADSVNIGANITTMGEDYSGVDTSTNFVMNSQIHGLTEFSSHLGFGLDRMATITNEDEDNKGYDEPVGSTGVIADLVMPGSGTLYVKLEGLDALEIEYDAEDEDSQDVALDASATFDEINGKWYQLSIEEVLEFLGIDQDTARPVADFYHCAVAVAGQDYSRELKELYRAFPFLDATKSETESSTTGTTVYDLMVDYDALADFVNALPTLGMMESFYVCYNTMADSLRLNELSAESFDEVSADELAEIFSASSYVLQAEITNFGHELVRLSGYGSENPDEYSMVMDFDYTYQELSAPEEYWTGEDLVEVMKDYSTVFLNQVTISGPNEVDDDDEDNTEEIEENEWYNDDGWYLGEDLYEDEDEE